MATLRILVVDDQEDGRKSMRVLIGLAYKPSDTKVEVRTAPLGGLYDVLGGEPDIVIFEPFDGRSGWAENRDETEKTFEHQLAVIRASGARPIVLTTQPALAANAEEVAVLLKPVALDTLIDALDRAVARRAALVLA